MTDKQITLGELIAALSAFARDKGVRFDFEYARPTTLASWRGVYAELALGFTFDAPSANVTVGPLLDHLQSAVGETFTGYKGGDFVMDKETPLWVANYGNCGTTAIQGVLDLGYEVVICTGHCGRYG